MGNCFSHSKNRPLPPTLTAHKQKEAAPATQKTTQEINWEMCSDQRDAQRNGNNVPSETLLREKSFRTFPLCNRATRTNSSEVKLGKAVSETRINALFENYRDTTEDNILAEGIERLCADLNLSPDEFRVLILAWKLDASQMCRFTRDEFVKGCKVMHVDTIKGIQSRLPDLASEVLENSELFKDLYRFTFRFGLDSSSGQRILQSDMAILLWKLVFSGQEPPILNRWLRFLECHQHVRGIPRDTWNMFLNFSEAVGNDLSTYDDTEAWPSIFDDFVEFENDQANQNITSKEKEEVMKMGRLNS